MFGNWFLSLYSSDIVMSGFIGAILGGLISGIITWAAMFAIDKQAKKRWENEGYLKRQIDLEIEIRKYLIKLLSEYLNLEDISGLKDFTTQKVDEAYLEKIKIYDDYLNVFFKNFKELSNHIDSIENFLPQEDKKISFLINEYTEFNPKLKDIFKKFWNHYSKIGKINVNHQTMDDEGNIQECNAILNEIINDRKADKLNDSITNFIQLEKQCRVIIEKIKPKLY